MMLFIVFAGMLVLQWQLALLTLIPCVPLTLATRNYAPRVKSRTREARRLQSIFSGEVGNRVDKLTQSKWLDADPVSRRKLRKLATSVSQVNRARDKEAARLQGLGQLFAFLSIPILFAVGVTMSWQGALTVGRFMAFAWLATQFASTLNSLVKVVAIQEKANVSKDRMLFLLQRSSEGGRSSHLKAFNAKGQSIEYRDIVLRGRSLAEPINLRCNRGGIAILPPEVSMSDCVDSVLGYVRTEKGDIFVDGQNVREVNVRSLRQAIAWVPTQPMLFDDTVENNILAAAPRLSDRELNTLVAKLRDEPSQQWLKRPAGDKGRLIQSSDVSQIAILRAVARKPSFLFVSSLPDDDPIATLLCRAIELVSQDGMVLICRSLAEQLSLTQVTTLTPQEIESSSAFHSA